LINNGIILEALHVREGFKEMYLKF